MLNRAITLASFVLCCCALIAAAFSLSNELSYSRAQAITDVTTVDELKTTLEQLQKINFNHYLPYSQTRELEGELLMRISMLSPKIDEDQLNQAVLAFRSSIKNDPANGSLWGKLALSKALLKQYDPEFDMAMQRVFEYSGWEFDSAETIIKIGLANPQELSVDSLLIVKESVRRLYSANPFYTIYLARKMNQMHLACIWARDITPANPWCLNELQ